MAQILNVFPLTIYVDKISKHEIYKEDFYKLYPKYDYDENTGASTVSEGYVDPFILLEPSLEHLFNEIAGHVRSYIHETLNVPVGIIVTSWGGTQLKLGQRNLYWMKNLNQEY